MKSSMSTNGSSWNTLKDNRTWLVLNTHLHGYMGQEPYMVVQALTIYNVEGAIQVYLGATSRPIKEHVGMNDPVVKIQFKSLGVARSQRYSM
ncbi:hypothetical protein VNO77_34490 [Canavalia gladiata]|uniref:Uncharacterized protein n=1 Tax=Canavalia gladiata TaxID=3824 RepID=A0AAN9KGI4_CANGL